MTRKEMNDLCEEYSRCYDCLLSHKAQNRMRELDAYAAEEGLKFKMVDWVQYGLPSYLGPAEFRLVPIGRDAPEST